MKKALIVTGYKYPDGDAGAVRQHSFAKILEALDFSVTVVSLGECTGFEVRDNDGIKYISLRYDGSGVSVKIKNRLNYIKNFKAFIEKNGIPQIIMVAEVDFFVLLFLKKYAQKHKIKLLYDSVEWYSPEEFKCGRLSPQYIINNRLNTKWLRDSFSVVSISSYLENHFNSIGVESERVPVILDICSTPSNKRTLSQKTVFLYAGSPGRNDYISVIIKAFSLLPTGFHDMWELRFAGINKEQLVSLCGADKIDVEKIDKSVVCFGRIGRDEVLNQLSQADFTVLMRPQDAIYSKAGFPTKVVESMATATPVIANITSDLGLYLKDGKNSLTVNSCLAEELAKVLEKALTLTSDEKKQMCQNARMTAEKYFDYRNYLKIMEKLIG